MISTLLREVVSDLHSSFRESHSVLEAHLLGIDGWYSTLPENLTFEDLSLIFPEVRTNASNTSNSKINDFIRKQNAMVNLRLLRSGTVCLLLQPVLMNAVRTPPTHISNDDFNYARRCFDSAADIIIVSVHVCRAGQFAYWLSSLLQFVFNAALIVLLEIIWARQSSVGNDIEASSTLVDMADEVLKHAAPFNKAAKGNLFTLRILRTHMEHENARSRAGSEYDGMAQVDGSDQAMPFL